MARSNQEIAAEWLEYAAIDLAAAEKLGADPDFVRQVLYLSEQAGEKALKSVVAAAGETPRRYGHNLVQLLDRCVQLHSALEEVREDAELLTDYGVEPRYPESPDDYSSEDAAEAIEAARRIITAVSQVS